MSNKTKKCKCCSKDFEPFDEKRSEICGGEECKRLERKKSLKGLKKANNE